MGRRRRRHHRNGAFAPAVARSISLHRASFIESEQPDGHVHQNWVNVAWASPRKSANHKRNADGRSNEAKHDCNIPPRATLVRPFDHSRWRIFSPETSRTDSRLSELATVLKPLHERTSLDLERTPTSDYGVEGVAPKQY